MTMTSSSQSEKAKMAPASRAVAMLGRKMCQKVLNALAPKSIEASTVPHAVAGKLTLRHLMQMIHSRDTWMHRLDICRATNRHFEQTIEHDGRIAALVMLDVARQLSPKLDGRAIAFDLSGLAGGTWSNIHSLY